ncbi:MAG: glycosyltransferase family 2 protein [Xanthobacteraceae bacterium]|nr:glycosyltransferase family 2 protein [Xanthobacteraceae bacterium]
MPEPSVSVAMCSYNMAAYIGEQLASLVRQTRRPNELIVCDDGSDDQTVAIVRAFAAGAPFDVRIVQNDPCIGCNQNFEKAISLCNGDIIFLCDHDDVWRERKIEMLLALMRDEDVGAAFGDADVVLADLTPRGFTLWDTCNFNPARRKRFAAGAQFSELIVNNVMQGAAAAFKSSLRPAILPIPPEWQHDYWIALIVAAHARINFTEACVLDYRQHDRNLIGAGMPHRASSWTAMRRLRHRTGRWFKKLRSPTGYYNERLADVRRELQPMSVLRERLMRLDQATIGVATSLVEEEIARLTRQQTRIQDKMRRWSWTAPRSSRASET